MGLYQKWRPTSLDDFIGNEDLVGTVRTDLSSNKPAQAYLLTGPTGCGKTTLARIMGRMLGAEGPNFHEVDSADFRGIDTVRDIRRQAMFRPLNGGKSRVWLTDEAHKLTNDAQNAFLKGLEDPPPHVYFILATTDPQKLLPTIKGRCVQYTVRSLKYDDMLRLLRRVVRGEEAQINSRDVYEQIVQDSEGLPRNALMILEQVLNADPAKRLSVAKREAEKQSSVIELCRALLDGGGWKRVRNILSSIQEQGEEDPERVRRAILSYCSTVLLKGENDKAGIILERLIDPLYDSGWPGLVFNCYYICHD